MLGFGVLGVVILLILIGFAYWNQNTQETQEDKLQVVTTLFPVYDWTRQITGQNADVSLLLTGGAGAHDTTLTPQASQQLAKADMLITVGAGLESFLEVPELKRENPELVVVDLSDAVTNLIEIEGEEHSGFNPHIWLSPKLTIPQVELILETLKAQDSAQAAAYEARGQAYLTSLLGLDSEYTNAAQAFTQKSFISFHDAMPYVARDYGLEQVAVIEDFPGQAPSPQDIISLQELITQTGVRVIFTEPQFSPQVAETLAADTGAQLAEFDTLEVADIEVDTYVKKMQQNLENMKSVLQ